MKIESISIGGLTTWVRMYREHKRAGKREEGRGKREEGRGKREEREWRLMTTNPLK